ncbi:hypothetical protein JCM33374_g3603 [Metschnikowia sp. JCM 33374]|nr:hypothetical protein JCM33374_g3603 [Metschnikowia sp. JCM 33374]
MPVTLQDLTREPDFLEKTFRYCEKNKLFRCVSISARINRPLDADVAFGSVRSLVLKYPLLFSRLSGEEPNITYVPLEAIRFEDVFVVRNDAEVCFKAENAQTDLLTDASFHENHVQKKPLWRFVYHKKTGWITFQSAHCFTDGGSVVAYLKDFVEGLNHVAGVTAKDMVFNLQDDLSLLKYGISPGFFDRVNYQTNLATRLVAHAIKSAIWLWPGVVPAVLEKKRVESFFVDRTPEPFSPDSFFESEHIIDEKSSLNLTTPTFLNIDSDSLQAILRQCRAHNVRLQSYILLVYVHTVNSQCPDMYTSKNLKVAVAASFRNRFESLQSHNKYLGGGDVRFEDGFYTYAATFFLEPGTEFSWPSVQKYHNFLHQKVNSEEWIRQYYFAHHTMTAENYMDHRLGNEKDTLFISSTNLGHIDVLQYDDPSKFQIEDILFAPMTGALMGTHHVTLSSTAKGGLNIGLSNGDPNVKDWAVFKRELKKNLVLFSTQSV